jgi:hypothetical protein
MSFFLEGELGMFDGSSVVELVKDLREQVKVFLREEVHLAKAEFSEKISHVVKDAINIAIGGFVAYAGLIVFLAGIGALLAFAFQRLELDPTSFGFPGVGNHRNRCDSDWGDYADDWPESVEEGDSRTRTHHRNSPAHQRNGTRQRTYAHRTAKG